jgi:hypothetical protein
MNNNIHTPQTFVSKKIAINTKNDSQEAKKSMIILASHMETIHLMFLVASNQ